MKLKLLEDYCDLRKEVQDILHRIDHLTTQMERMEQASTDYVRGSKRDGIYQYKQIRIEEYSSTYERRNLLLQERLLLLRWKEEELFQLTNAVEEYIEEQIKDSRTRTIFRMRFLDHMTQREIAEILHMDRSNISKIITNELL